MSYCRILSKSPCVLCVSMFSRIWVRADTRKVLRDATASKHIDCHWSYFVCPICKRRRQCRDRIPCIFPTRLRRNDDRVRFSSLVLYVKLATAVYVSKSVWLVVTCLVQKLRMYTASSTDRLRRRCIPDSIRLSSTRFITFMLPAGGFLLTSLRLWTWKGLAKPGELWFGLTSVGCGRSKYSLCHLTGLHS